MRHLPLLSGLMATLLIVAPARSGGVRDMLFPSTFGATTALPTVVQAAVSAHFTYTATLGTGPAQGDLLVAYGFQEGCTGGGPVPPSVAAGWTLIDSRTATALVTPPGATLAYKIAGASEPTSQTPFSGTPSTGGVAVVDLTNPGTPAFSIYAPTDQIVDNTYVAPGTAFPVNATPSVTPTRPTSLVLAFGGWVNCLTGSNVLTINSPFTGTLTDTYAPISTAASVLFAQQSVTGTSTVTATIQWPYNAAYGLDGAILVLNTP